MNYEVTGEQLEVKTPNFKPVLLGLGLVALVGLGLLVWQNRRLTGQIELSKAKLLMQQTPAITPVDSGTRNVAQVLDVNVLAVETTKGGVTPTVTPQPKPAIVKARAEKIVLTKVYLDSQFPFEIRFNDSWIFRRTHGSNTGGQSDQILSRVDLSRSNIEKPEAYVSAEVLSSKGLTDLNSWLKNYDSDYKYENGEKFEFNGQTAVKFYADGGRTQRVYFLKGAYAIRLLAWENDSLSTETLAIRDSFKMK